MLFVEADDRWEKLPEGYVQQNINQLEVIHQEETTRTSLRICQAPDGTVFKKTYSAKHGLVWYRYNRQVD